MLARAMGAAACTMLLLAGCASPKSLPSGAGADVWSGRLALTIHSEPPQHVSAGFDLRGSPQAGELQLSSPLGNSLATLRWDPRSAELIQGNTVTARDNLEALTDDIGAPGLPITALFSWLRGDAAEASGWTADLTRQPEGRIVARRHHPLPLADLRIVVQP